MELRSHDREKSKQDEELLLQRKADLDNKWCRQDSSAASKKVVKVVKVEDLLSSRHEGNGARPAGEDDTVAVVSYEADIDAKSSDSDFAPEFREGTPSPDATSIQRSNLSAEAIQRDESGRSVRYPLRARSRRVIPGGVKDGAFVDDFYGVFHDFDRIVDERLQNAGSVLPIWGGKRDRKPRERKPSHKTAVRNAILVRKKRSRRSRPPENTVVAAVHFKAIVPSSGPSSGRKIRSSEKANMVTHMQSFSGELGSHNEGPTTSMKPPLRKRKKGAALSDGSPECGRPNGFIHRPWSDGHHRTAQLQSDQLASYRASEVAERLRRAEIDNFRLARSAAAFDDFDPFLGGSTWQPMPTASQYSNYRDPRHPFNNVGANVGSSPHSNSQGGILLAPSREGLSVRAASEPTSNASIETAQSEGGEFSNFDELLETLSPTLDEAHYPSRSRRSLNSPINDPPTLQRVTSTAELFSESQPARFTLNNVTPPCFNTLDVVPADQIPNCQYDALGGIISFSANGAHTGVLDVLEGCEPDQPNDGNLLDKEEEAVPRFDLNEPPDQQPGKVTKPRKKHRPKVFREGQPARARKPKKAEEKVGKPKASEGPKVVDDKPRARKKRATAGSVKGKQGSQSTPAAADCGAVAADHNPSHDAELDTYIEHVKAQSGKDLSQSREYGMSQTQSAQMPSSGSDFTVVRKGSTTLIFQRETNSLHAPDGSPLPTTTSIAESLTRKRTSRSVASAGPKPQRGVRRELFKNVSWGKRAMAVEQESPRLGQNCEGTPNVAWVHPNSVSAAETVGSVSQTRSDSSMSQAVLSLDARLRAMRAKLGDLRSFGAAEDGVVKPWNPNESHIVSSDVPMTDGSGSTVTSGDSDGHRRRMRAAARAKPWQSSTQKLNQVVKDLGGLELSDKLSGLELVPHVNQHGPMVPYQGPIRRKKARAKVLLDLEDKRVWQLVMANGTSFEDNDPKQDASKRWDEERAIMKVRAENFINRMHQVQGDRTFSPWKGSVVDSVVGAFLTQNVSDHLSSSAFMSLAAQFPVSREKETAAEPWQEATVTEVHIEEAHEVDLSLSRFPSDGAEAAQEISVVTVAHVEEAFDASEKSSVTGGGSSVCCNRQDHDVLSTQATDYNCDSEQTIQSPDKWGGSTQSPTLERDYLAEKPMNWSPDFREQNSSCSSQGSQCPSTSFVHNVSPQAVESLEVRGNGDENPSRVVEDFASLHSGPEEVVSPTLGCSLLNSTGPLALVDFSDQEVPSISVPSSKSMIQNVPQLPLRSIVVDLGFPAADPLMESGPLQKSTCSDFLSHANDLSILENAGHSVVQERTHPGVFPRFEVPCITTEEVGASSGSLISSSDSTDTHKLSQSPLQPGSEVNCVRGDVVGANPGRVVYNVDSLELHNSPRGEQQLVSSAARNPDDDGDQRDGSLLHAKESLNLHTVKKLIRTSKTGSDSAGNSELGNSSSSNHEKGAAPFRRRGAYLGLTGIQRGTLEQANISSKVAFDWEAVRLKYKERASGEEQTDSAHSGCKSFRSSSAENGADWDAVRVAKLEDIAFPIKARGMHFVLAGRIKAFLERVQQEHGSVDLEWLRTIPVEEAKSFLLSIRGLGLKSVECIRLLTLHHLAFPVDTNVGRICVRLGWVPLEPLPEELQLHLLELYPIQETIQKYLWPRLCSLDQRTLYELHYQMITFGKVFCTKSRPNCNACPMREDCRHFASALTSARLLLPAAAHDDAQSTNSERLALPAAAAEFIKKTKLALEPSGQDSTQGGEGPTLSKLNSFISSQKTCEPIIEEPSTPEHVADVIEIDDMEDLFKREEELGVSSQLSGVYNKDTSTENEIDLPPAQVSISGTAPQPSQALVLLHPAMASLPVPKLKNAGRLRTVHYVYELPHSHPLLQQMDALERDDPSFYLLAIWSPGEVIQLPPQYKDVETDKFSAFENTEEETVNGTVLIPCRTAMRGNFPLNGTYFQVNEVFADHASSLQPLVVPRTLLWNLKRRFVYFGTSVTTIFKGLSVEEIQACFWKGYVCVRGFDSTQRCPKPLAHRLHLAASKMVRKSKRGEKVGDSDAEIQN